MAAQITKIRLQIMKNLLVVCIGFLLLFCAFQALANLQSTINSEEGLGVVSQSVIYAALIVSSLFLPKLIIRKLGCKWTLVLSIMTYCPYIAANFWPRMSTFIPTAVILGLGAAPLWAAKCTYLNEIGCQYAIHTNVPNDIIISRFFGIFFMFFQNTQIWGNLVSYYVLKPGNETEFHVSNDSLEHCGINFCVVSNVTNPNLQPPKEQQRFTLIGIYLTCAVLAAVIVALFLDPLERSGKSDEESKSLTKRLVATIKHMGKLSQALLIPLTVYSGIEQAFFLGDYTSAYIACTWGVYHVGYVFICYGIVNAVMSFLSGRLLQYLPRLLIMGLGFTGNLGACIAMFLWSPDPTEAYVFFIIAGVWGFSDAIWQTQVNALYGTLFVGEEEAAFSNYRLWESLGFSIAFAYSKLLCAAAKVYILLGFLVIGMAGYTAVELINFKKKGEIKLNGN